jgi:hypothetical protein
MTDQLYLISLNKDAQGNDVNYVLSRDEWKLLLATARARGWSPLGTILDFEFHIQLETSQFEELDQNGYAEIAISVLDKCRSWHGGYYTPAYQVLVDQDSQRLGQALHGTDANPDFLQFLSLGAFRIAG